MNFLIGRPGLALFGTLAWCTLACEGNGGTLALAQSVDHHRMPAPQIDTMFVERVRRQQVRPETLPKFVLREDRIPAPLRQVRVLNTGGLQAAIDAAKPGDELLLEPGATYRGPIVLRRKAAMGGAWITLRTRADSADSADSAVPPGTRVTPESAARFAIISANPTDPIVTTEPGAHNYRLSELSVAAAASARSGGALVALGSGDKSQSTLASQPYNLILDRVYVHGHPGLDFRRCIALNSGATAIVDSWISECHGRGFDSQAIWGSNGTGPYKIVNNYLEGAGENVMFGGSDPHIPDALPSDIEFRRNHVFKPLSWQGVWSVKNSFELKIGKRILIEGNIFENCWADAQIGLAIVMKSTNQENSAPWSQTADITLQYNILRNVKHGIGLAARPEQYPALPMSRVRIAHNTISGADRVIQTSGIQGLSIENNAALGGFNGFLMHDQPGANTTVINNVFGTSRNFVASADGKGIGTEGLDYHAGAGWIFRRNVVIGAAAGSYPADNYYPATVDLVGFTDMRRSYELRSGTLYSRGGTDGKAIGPDFAALRAATEGVALRR